MKESGVVRSHTGLCIFIVHILNVAIVTEKQN